MYSTIHEAAEAIRNQEGRRNSPKAVAHLNKAWLLLGIGIDIKKAQIFLSPSHSRYDRLNEEIRSSYAYPVE